MTRGTMVAIATIMAILGGITYELLDVLVDYIAFQVGDCVKSYGSYGSYNDCRVDYPSLPDWMILAQRKEGAILLPAHFIAALFVGSATYVYLNLKLRSERSGDQKIEKEKVG